MAVFGYPLQWRHNGRDRVSNHEPHDCLLNSLFRCRSGKTSKLRVTGLCARNSTGTGEFPVQMASNAENVSIWWRHHSCIVAIFVSYVVLLCVFPAHELWINHYKLRWSTRQFRVLGQPHWLTRQFEIILEVCIYRTQTQYPGHFGHRDRS